MHRVLKQKPSSAEKDLQIFFSEFLEVLLASL